ncbi:uncharacterized protein PSFLO_02556 [Pseudozyma flocculosa]|uniref:Uncharacterized protein n=1 Tax=Pseudozyma flocculosa TaxID=84751 RepID=A0A5C3EXW2_9BASI|nr:uncharacterized protein PSFLO_02556 [Pseudozyma flocculosa]
MHPPIAPGASSSASAEERQTPAMTTATSAPDIEQGPAATPDSIQAGDRCQAEPALFRHQGAASIQLAKTYPTPVRLKADRDTMEEGQADRHAGTR